MKVFERPPPTVAGQVPAPARKLTLDVATRPVMVRALLTILQGALLTINRCPRTALLIGFNACSWPAEACGRNQMGYKTIYEYGAAQGTAIGDSLAARVRGASWPPGLHVPQSTRLNG